MKKILITGASGFVGKSLTTKLIASNYDIVQYNRDLDWPNSFSDFHAIIHLAAKVHDMSRPEYEDYVEGNVKLTEKLLKRAISDGVKHFIFLSSIKVNGEEYSLPYNEAQVQMPSDPYGKSKWEAENIIRSTCLNQNLINRFQTFFTIIRPPLIYGKEVRANFKALCKIAKLQIPLPFDLVDNKRSFISLNNLIDLIIYCLTHPEESKNKTILATDGSDFSLKELISLLANAQGKKSYFYPIPLCVLKTMFSLIGKKSIYSRLCENLLIDNSQLKSQINWTPPYRPQDEIKKMF